MAIPTGHRTITRKDGIGAWRAANEGDTYIDTQGRHWECRGTFVKPAPSEVQQTIEAMKNARVNECGQTPTRTWHGVGMQAQNLAKDWRQERGIPAGLEIKYESSYTKTVVDGLLALGEYRNTFPAIRAAIDLLKDYHSSLSAPYAQRDKARQEVVVLEAQLATVQNKLRLLKVRFSNRMRLLANMATRWKKDLE